MTVFGDQNIVLDAHADLFIRNVDSGLDGDNHPRFEFAIAIAGIVNVQSEMMADAVNVVGQQGFPVFVL